MEKIARSVLFSIILILGMPVFALAGSLPDTGQTKCYNNSAEIACPGPGEDFYGQDGSYLINPPSCTKLDAGGNDLANSAASWVMVRDNVTGLIWEVKTDDGSINDKDAWYNWQDAQDVFIASLNSADFGGHSDWRLPRIKELVYIVNYGTNSPSINTSYFPNTKWPWGSYWSSTTPVHRTSNAWEVNFEDADMGHAAKSNSYYVRAVRGGESGSFDNLVINGDDTVTDTSTGLMWQQATAGAYNWKDALSYSEGLTLAGYTDWRLPNIKEIQSIVDGDRYSPAININYFPDTISSYYWSSTSRDTNPLGGMINLSTGQHSYDDKWDSHYVRAVRGPIAWVLPPPTVTTETASSVSSTSATLNGTVNAKGGSTTVTFEYGLTTGYGSTATATQSPLTGGAPLSVSTGLTGLSGATTYHFRVKATNSAGTTYGDDQTFTTSALPTTTTTTTTTTSTTSTTTTTSATTTTTTTVSTTSATTTSATTTFATTTSVTTTTPTSTTVSSTTTTLPSAPTMSIGSSSGEAGGTITIPITLSNQSGTSLAAVSVDIGYDTAVFQSLSAAIGPAGESADKEVATGNISSGLFRVSVLSGSNNKTMGNGVIAYITLKVQNDARIGLTTLTSTASGSDASGGSVTVNGSSGTVTILGDIPGDCDGDGTVSIAEVQSAINMFLGINIIEDCVDVNGNGKVSIGEVQKIINKHLRLSAPLPASGLSSPEDSLDISNTFRASTSPTLSIGQGTGDAGETVTVPVTLRNVTGYDISALSSDITYDTNILDGPTVVIGPAGTAASKTVSSSKPSSGTLRIGILSVSNNDAIGTGVVAYITFSVKTASGRVTLNNSPEASDPSGNDISINGVNGSITAATVVYVDSTGQCGGNGSCYSGVQNAIDSASSYLLMRLSSGTYDEDLVIDQAYGLTLSGGWDSTFTTQSSSTVINSITINGTSGTAELDNVILQDAD